MLVQPAHPERGWRSAGFTLIELLVVLAIMGLVGGVLMLTLPDDGNDVHRQAERFANTLLHARDAAILGGRPLLVVVEADGYAFERQSAGQWRPLQEGPMRPQAWTGHVQARIPPERERISFRFDSTGLAEPQAVSLVQGRHAVEIALQANGQVRVEGAAHGR